MSLSSLRFSILLSSSAHLSTFGVLGGACDANFHKLDLSWVMTRAVKFHHLCSFIGKLVQTLVLLKVRT